MKKWRVTVTTYAYYTVDIDAETAADAEAEVDRMICDGRSVAEICGDSYDDGVEVVMGETYEVEDERE